MPRDRDGNGERLDPIETFLPLAYQIHQLDLKLAAQARSVIAGHGGLSLPQWRVLRVIGMRVATSSTAVRKSLGFDKSQFSKTVSSMVEADLIRVGPHARDRRQSELNLTPKGQAALDQLGPVLDDRNKHLLATLSPTERKVIATALAKLSRAAEITEFDNEDPET
ncbi:MarR family winged helix-turn-helix transcriptional regulator [Maritimibacter sp. UBA3975]|uniref:MarR family winged helix-turn-helix transcriptional regulator n=1 Tax=Maritimibacter sp. UBA3975 TaxID=1946833 RepID=UPI000C098013|nr:MarR family winged helix-turn-helix transcriptional regulator [Maritimibacter sp. UBA3975]MAM62218.1 MarR family transcriptional regulator [Maritimibacter sp.]|tara:strand:- start:35007 stop:35504 length:498 start_codon:yes stop_codon:yes gene_type:complete